MATKDDLPEDEGHEETLLERVVEHDLDSYEETGSITAGTFWMNVVERGIKTFAQAVVVALAGVTAIDQVDWVDAISVAGLAALASVLLALVGASVPSTDNPLVDMAERAGRTFVASLIATLSLYTALHDVPWQDALVMAGITALLSLVTSTASVTATGTASALGKNRNK